MLKTAKTVKAWMMAPFVEDMYANCKEYKAPKMMDVYTCALIETGFLALDIKLIQTTGKIVGKGLALNYKYVIKPVVKTIVKVV